MKKIRNNVFISNVKDANNATLLKKHKITAILNCAYECEDDIQDYKKITMYKVGLSDNDKNQQYVKDIAINVATNLILNGERVLIHCGAGMSRSVFVACMALAAVEVKDPDKVFQEIRNVHPFAMKGALWQGYGYKPIGYEE